MPIFLEDHKVYALTHGLSYLGLLVYLIFVVWALVRCSRRWVTLLLMIASLIAGLLVAVGVLRYVPEIAYGWGDLDAKLVIAQFLAMLTSAGVGWKYLKTHRRALKN
jgi:O-antigen ligase